MRMDAKVLKEAWAQHMMRTTPEGFIFELTAGTPHPDI